MKKLLLYLVYILLISCAVSCVCASDEMENATMDHDFIQKDLQHIVVDNTTVTAARNSTLPQTENVTGDDNNTVQINETSTSTTNNKAPKLNITGPKINPGLNISGPKGSDFSSLHLSEHDKLVLYCTNICIKHPDFTLGEIINAFGKKNWYHAPKIIPEAYAKALKNNGAEMLYSNGITEFDVVKFMMENGDSLYPNE